MATGSCQIAFAAAGTHNLTATYGGDANFNGSASTPATVHVVNKAATTTAITGDSPDPSVVDQTYTVTWTVTVNGPGAGSPTGTVTVDDGAGNTCSAAVAAGTCDLASTSAGAKTLTATYGGDSNFLTSADTESHTVNTRASSTSVDCQPGSIVVDQPTTCTVTVTDIDGLGTKSDPSGTVTFSSSETGTFDFTTCALVGNGDDTSDCSVVYTPTAKGTGLHVIGASYGGSTVHSASFDIDGSRSRSTTARPRQRSSATARSSSVRVRPAPRRSMTSPAPAHRPPRRARSTSWAKARVASTPPPASSPRSMATPAPAR